MLLMALLIRVCRLALAAVMGVAGFANVPEGTFRVRWIFHMIRDRTEIPAPNQSTARRGIVTFDAGKLDGRPACALRHRDR